MSGKTLTVQITIEGPNYSTKELSLDTSRPECSLKVAFFGNYWVKYIKTCNNTLSTNNPGGS